MYWLHSHEVLAVGSSLGGGVRVYWLHSPEVLVVGRGVGGEVGEGVLAALT